METSYLKMIKGSRLTNYVGLHMDSGVEPLTGKNYLHLDIPLAGAESEDGLVQEVKRNQHVFIRAAASVNVKGRQFLEVEPNSKLAELGQVQGLYRIHPDSGETRLGFWFTARKDTNLAEIVYAVRLYMPS